MKIQGLRMGAAIGVAALAATLISYPALPAASRVDKAESGVPVQMVVTVEAHHGNEAPRVQQQNVRVSQDGKPVSVLSWVPAEGQNAGMELLVLLDDSAGLSLGSQIGDLKAFIAQQPPTTMIGIGYMHDGTVEMTQNFTSDHAAAEKALRLPTGSAVGAASPYFSLMDLRKRWGIDPLYPRREILLMSRGGDPYEGGQAEDPYVDDAIAAMQTSGIVVFTIQAPGRRFGTQFWGADYLAMLAEKSGGEALNDGFIAPVSFEPFLDELTRMLNEQYLLTFEARAEKKPELQKVKVTTDVPNGKLLAADEAYVPGARAD